MASPIIDDADNVNDNICEDNTLIASGNNYEGSDKADLSYSTTMTTRTTATVTTTTTDEVTCELNSELNDININECDRDVLEVSLDNIKISPWSLFLVSSR